MTCSLFQMSPVLHLNSYLHVLESGITLAPKNQRERSLAAQRSVIHSAVSTPVKITQDDAERTQLGTQHFLLSYLTWEAYQGVEQHWHNGPVPNGCSLYHSALNLVIINTADGWDFWHLSQQFWFCYSLQIVIDKSHLSRTNWQAPSWVKFCLLRINVLLIIAGFQQANVSLWYR